MRIICNELDEFVDELSSQAAEGFVVGGIVRFTTMREWEQEEHLSCAVGVSATALLGMGDEPRELLEWTAEVGRDTQRERCGSKSAEVYVEKLVEVCDKFGLRVRPGKYELI